MGRAGPPPTPTKVLKLRGAFKHNPYREAMRGREPEPLGPLSSEVPAWVKGKREQECYRKIMATCHPDVLSVADEILVGIVAIRTAELYVRQASMPDSHMAQLMRGLGLLGMTPSDRTRVASMEPNKKTDNPYAEFAA